ncbi:MAG TPA: S46 family peptidase, partial [Thermoanaerobaculia bacterium]
AIDDELRATELQDDRREGAIGRLRPAWRRAVIAHAGKPVAPDANGTLRVSFAHVQGYQPRDAVVMTPQTRLQGIVEKHTGAEPFDVPDAILRAAQEPADSRFVDPDLGDVPVAFLADADTTGGNSGSPVVNGRGELVGINFDRVWENVANDFGFNPDIARSISVDVRYMLWILDEIEGAEALLEELGAR